MNQREGGKDQIKGILLILAFCSDLVRMINPHRSQVIYLSLHQVLAIHLHGIVSAKVYFGGIRCQAVVREGKKQGPVLYIQHTTDLIEGENPVWIITGIIFHQGYFFVTSPEEEGQEYAKKDIDRLFNSRFQRESIVDPDHIDVGREIRI